MYVERHEVAIETSAGGAFTGYTPVVTGEVVQYSYVPDGTTPLDTGADLDITGEQSGAVIANQDNIGTAAFTKAPRQASHGVAGGAALYAAAGEAVLVPIVVARERLKVVIAQGGNVKKGTLHIFVA